jgi:hypothetical protein
MEGAPLDRNEGVVKARFFVAAVFPRVLDKRSVWRTEALGLSRRITSADRSANHRFGYDGP